MGLCKCKCKCKVHLRLQNLEKWTVATIGDFLALHSVKLCGDPFFLCKLGTQHHPLIAEFALKSYVVASDLAVEAWQSIRREMIRHRGDGAWMEAVPLSRTADDQTLQD